MPPFVTIAAGQDGPGGADGDELLFAVGDVLKRITLRTGIGPHPIRVARRAERGVEQTDGEQKHCAPQGGGAHLRCPRPGAGSPRRWCS